MVGRQLLSLLRHHEFVAIRVHAHREMKGILWRILGFPCQAPSASFQSVDPTPEVIDLKSQPGPGSFTFSSAMNSNGGSGNHHFAPNLRFSGHLPREEVPVEMKTALPVGGPEGVFYFGHLHDGEGISAEHIRQQGNQASFHLEGMMASGFLNRLVT